MEKPANTDREPKRLIRLPVVQERTGLSRSAIYRLVFSSDFPQPIKLTERSTAWVEAEIDEWVTAKIAARRKANTSSR